MVSVPFCAYGRAAEAHWFTEAVHLVPSLGHWDTVSSSMTFSNPNHVLCMSSVCRDGLTGVFVHVRLVLCCILAAEGMAFNGID